MKVVYDFSHPIRLEIIFTKQFQYYTPRAVLMAELEKGEVVEWVDDDKTKFKVINKDRLVDIWAHRGADCDAIDDEYFWHEIFGSANPVSWPGDFDELMKNYFTINEGYLCGFDNSIHSLISLSTERRKCVLDLVPGKIYEWIIKFLLEQTRTDWAQWTSKEALEFQVSNCADFGKWYADVNELSKSDGPFIVKLLLNSYCMTKILSKVDNKNHVYKFDKDWYEREINKPANEGIEWYRDTETAVFRSRERFPSLTLQ